MKKLITILLALAATTALWANGVDINGIHYILAGDSAIVTWSGNDSVFSQDGTYSGSITIPSSVTYNQHVYNVVGIGSEAFYQCEDLLSVTIPNSVLSIGSYAFAMCTGLTSITIPNSVTSIGRSAFDQCTGLTSITISNSVTSIGFCAFAMCTGLTSITIPNSVTSIGGNAFYECTGLTSITIPNSVTSIGALAFHHTNISSPVYNSSIFAYLPRSYSGSYSIPVGITSIAGGAFYECTGLTSITIPNSVTSIGGEAFGCTGLTSITIPNSVTKIEFGAFAFTALTSVSIPNSVTSIGNMAFYQCTSLTSISIGTGLKTIDMDAFYECNIKSVYWNAIHCESDRNLLGESVETITFGDSVQVIPSGLCARMNHLTSVSIPNNVTKIEQNAFSYCTSLVSLYIPNSVNNIEYGAFDHVNNVEYHGTATGSPWSAKCVNGFVDGLLVYSDASKKILCGCSSSIVGGVNIPNTVTTIGDNAFYSCENLNAITIPNSVTNIGGWAFSGCIASTTISIPNSVTSIGSEAFYDVNNIEYHGTAAGSPWGAKCVNGFVDGLLVYSSSSKEVICGCVSTFAGSLIIPKSVKTIQEGAFYRCNKLTYIYTNNVKTIQNYAFYACLGLTHVNIGNCIDSIGYSAFSYCRNLRKVHLGNSVKFIGGCAFYTCDSLSSITIPNSVTRIESSTFDRDHLTSITIGKNVTSIGMNAFYCFNDCLKKVTCLADTPPAMEDWVFNRYSIQSVPLYVPANSVSAYQAANQWKDFMEILPIQAEEVTVTELESTSTETSVSIAWPKVDGAETYTIELRKESELVCSIDFNADGQLLMVRKSPSRSHSNQETIAQSVETGWEYTIEGLESGTYYTYVVIAKNEEGVAIDTKEGSFSTKAYTSIDDIQSDELYSIRRSSKIIENGHIYILRDGKTYTIEGQEVK